VETATAFQALDDLLEQIIDQVVETGRPPSEVIDGIEPIRLRPDDQRTVIREGLISIANDRRGMRGYRSGKYQSNPGRRTSLDLETEVIDDYHVRVLSRLVYEDADGAIKSVLEFTADDVDAAYDRRVRAPREQAEREEPFWTALAEITANGWTLDRRTADVQKRIARLAIRQGLTRNGEDSDA